MNRAMILSATIAAGLHVALLGFKSSPPAAPTPELVEEDATDPWILPQMLEDPPVPVTLVPNADPEDNPAPQPLVPLGAEIPAVESFVDFQIIRPPSPEFRVDGIDRIDPDWQNAATSGGPGVPWVLITELDNVPRALFRHSPSRPYGTGSSTETVTVDFVVGKDGRVAQMRIVDSSNPDFEDGCLRAIKRWRFEPGMRKNVAVAFRMQQTFVFTAHD